MLVPELEITVDASIFSFLITGIETIINNSDLKTILNKELYIFAMLRAIAKKQLSIRELPECISICKTIFKKATDTVSNGSGIKTLGEKISCLILEILKLIL